MNVSTKMTLEFSKKDAEQLFKEAVFKLLRDKYGISVSLDDIALNFLSKMEYDQFDRGPGSPVFSGVNASIKQVTPMDRSR